MICTPIVLEHTIEEIVRSSETGIYSHASREKSASLVFLVISYKMNILWFLEDLFERARYVDFPYYPYTNEEGKIVFGKMTSKDFEEVPIEKMHRDLKTYRKRGNFGKEIATEYFIALRYAAEMINAWLRGDVKNYVRYKRNFLRWTKRLRVKEDFSDIFRFLEESFKHRVYKTLA